MVSCEDTGDSAVFRFEGRCWAAMTLGLGSVLLCLLGALYFLSSFRNAVPLSAFSGRLGEAR